MKIILLVHLSGAKSHEAGTELDVDDAQALRFIDKDIAKCKNPADLPKLRARIEKIESDNASRDAEAKAILEKDTLEAELNGLYNDVVLKEAALNGVVLDGEQILEMVEELKKRILPINGSNYFDLKSLGDGVK